MGYYMDMAERSFRIDFEAKEKALKALKEFVKGREHLSWICCNEVIRAKTLEEAMRKCRYSVRIDFDDNIIDICFEGEKLGDDLIVFNVIAPFVRDGSFLEMRGEDNERWRWLFKYGVCREVYPTVTWD